MKLARTVEALLIALLAVVTLADGWRIAGTLRATGNFGVVGPDRYLFIIGCALLAMSVVHLFAGREVAPVAADAEAEPGSAPIRAALYAVALIAYAAVVPFTGYLVATLLFFLFAFRIGGVDRWSMCVLAAAIATLGYYAVFVWLAGVAFPEGLLGSIVS